MDYFVFSEQDKGLHFSSTSEAGCQQTEPISTPYHCTVIVVLLLNQYEKSLIHHHYLFHFNRFMLISQMNVINILFWVIHNLKCMKY